MAFIITIAMALLYRLQDSRVGRAWNAIREDELAAAANGINTVTTKLLAFALGATTAGLAGVFNASKLTIVSPDQFYFTVSFTVLAMVILGGMGNIWGVAAGAFIVYMIQAVFLKQLNTVKEMIGIPPIDLGPIHFDLAKINFLDYQFLLYGVALVLMMLFRPEGLFPSQRRRRELHVADDLAVDLGEDIDDEPGIAGALGEIPGTEELYGESAGEDCPDDGTDDRSDGDHDRRGLSAEILHAKKVTKRFGGLVAVNSIDFTIPRGSIVSLIGPNGAGKTTFFNIIAGHLRPDRRSDRVPRRADDRALQACLDGAADLADRAGDRGGHHRDPRRAAAPPRARSSSASSSA